MYILGENYEIMIWVYSGGWSIRRMRRTKEKKFRKPPYEVSKLVTWAHERLYSHVQFWDIVTTFENPHRCYCSSRKYKSYFTSQVVPWGLRETLRYIKEKYNNPPVFITENGYCNKSRELNDLRRINYFRVPTTYYVSLFSDNIVDTLRKINLTVSFIP